MVPKNSDTDPSTPIARRPPSRAPAAIAAAAAETQPEGIAAPGGSGGMDASQADQTDPGVGPPAPLRSLAPQMVGVVVPVAAGPVVAGPAVAAALADAIAESPESPSSPAAGAHPGAARQDSVELLLSGISGPRPARSRTTPQTGGQASAVYHAEHQLHSAPPPSEQSKNVLIDRPPTPRAIPVAAAAARKAAQGRSPSPEATVVTERALARRLVLALVGALLVVAALFTVFQVSRLRAGDARSPTVPAAAAPAVAPMPPAEPPPTAAAPQSPPATPSAVATPPSGSAEVAAPEPSAPAAPESTAPSASAASHPSARPLLVAPSLVHKRRRVGGLTVSPASSGGDVGEFKTTF